MTDLGVLTTLPYDRRTRDFFDYLDRRRHKEAVGPGPHAGVWEVFRYDEAVQVLGDFRTFSNDMNAVIPESQQQLARTARGNFVGVDPPRHTELRSLISKAFTRQVVAGLEPVITEIAERLLDQVAVAQDGSASFDLVSDFAGPLTAIMIAKLFGIPESDHGLFTIWADALLSARPPGELGLADEAAVKEVAQLVRYSGEYLLNLIREKRANLTDDLTSALIQAEVDGQRLDDDEIAGVIGIFVIAGHLPASVLIANTVMCLDTHPEAFAELRRDPEVLPSLLDEVLRWRPPLVRDQRITTRETELGGQKIPSGSMVCVWLASAHRDETHFERPEEFDIHRKNPGGHLALGKGIHYCLGAPLAKLEARVALTALLRRFEAIEVLPDGGVEFHSSIGVLGPIHLPVAVRAKRGD